jgi:hypothetical protein
MNNLNIDWQILTRKFSEYFSELICFNFSVVNPVFWLFFLILLLILVKSWKIKKAFSFCFVIALILLAETQIENHVMDFFRRNKEQFDPLLIRIACVIIILVVSLYYFFIRGEND